MILKGSLAGLKSYIGPFKDRVKIFNSPHADLRLVYPKNRPLLENNFSPRIQKDMGGYRMLGIVIEFDIFNNSRVHSMIHHLGDAFGYPTAGGQFQGHGQYVF